MSKQLRARVTTAEYEAAINAAQKSTKFVNHAQIAETIVERLREIKPDTVSALIRVSCGLSLSPDSSEDEKSSLQIRVGVRDEAEENIVTDFLRTYRDRRGLARDIAARLRDRVPLLHPSELFRAIVGLPPAKVGAPEGNQNHAGKPGGNQHTARTPKKG
jgi:hypothetical protein